MSSLEAIRTRILKSYVPARISTEEQELPDPVRRALPNIRRAMDILHDIFMRQQDEGLSEIFPKKMKTEGGLGEFYRRFQGPWYPVEDYKSYDPEVPDRRPGCSLYPQDMTVEEFKNAVKELSPELREVWESPTTAIRRDDRGALEPIPYHVLYAEALGDLFDELSAAADILDAGGEERLAEYLRVKAEALVSGNYREADSEWVRLKEVPMELVIGPYEVYSDALFGRKAMYEGMLLRVDKERCDRLSQIEENLDALAAAFPLPNGSKPAVGGLAPMIVANLIYNAGEARQPIYPAAFNLPNDPWVRGNVGWKQVMLYNVMQAKFSNATLPIAGQVLAEEVETSFEPYFYEVILHEVSHGLGPAYRADGRTVDNSLGAHYTAIEEAKADTGGLFFLLEFGGSYGIPKFEEKALIQSYVAAQFRSMRFGINEAHGAANVIEHNWMLACGGISRGSEGYTVDPDKAKKGIRELLQKLCELEASAAQEEAEAFLEKWAQADEKLLEAIRQLEDIPIDLFLEFE